MTDRLKPPPKNVWGFGMVSSSRALRFSEWPSPSRPRHVIPFWHLGLQTWSQIKKLLPGCHHPRSVQETASFVVLESCKAEREIFGVFKSITEVAMVITWSLRS